MPAMFGMCWELDADRLHTQPGAAIPTTAVTKYKHGLKDRLERYWRFTLASMGFAAQYAEVYDIHLS
jgi:hypothetical protein